MTLLSLSPLTTDPCSSPSTRESRVKQSITAQISGLHPAALANNFANSKGQTVSCLPSVSLLVGLLGVDPAASLEVTLKECHVLPESEPSLTKKASKSEHSLVQAFGAQFFRSVDAATAVFL